MRDLVFYIAVAASLTSTISAQPPPPRVPCESAPCPSAGPVAVSLGAAFGCGLSADGTVRCWGRSSDGQGGEVTDAIATPRVVRGIDRVVAIGAGYAHVCALREGGEVWCWGDGDYHQLGVEGVSARATPTRVDGLEDVRELAVGSFHNCALRGDGAVLCWGSDDSGNLGTGREREKRARPEPVPGVRATRLWSGSSYACARERRRVRCWGLSEHGQAGTGRRVRTARPTVLRGVRVDDELVLAESFGCAVAPSGAVRCWGNNLFNVNGAISMHPRPVNVPLLGRVTRLHARSEDLCFVREGQVLCQGVNRRDHLRVPTEEMGNVVSDPSALPGVSDATEIVTGWFAQCLRHEDGRWSCWGWNRGPRYGVVGVGSTESYVTTPTPLPW